MNYGNNKIYCIYNARVHNFKPNTSFSFIYSRKKKKKRPANSNNAKTELLILQIIMFVYTTAGWWRNNYACASKRGVKTYFIYSKYLLFVMAR